jgi:hypothetical protein
MRVLSLFSRLGAPGSAALPLSPTLAAAMADLEPTGERRTLKSRPSLVLLILFSSCSAFGYTIYRLLKGMHL